MESNFTMGIFQEEQLSFNDFRCGKSQCMFVLLQKIKAKARGNLEVLEGIYRNSWRNYFGAYPWPNDKTPIVENPYLGRSIRPLMRMAYYDL